MQRDAVHGHSTRGLQLCEPSTARELADAEREETIQLSHLWRYVFSLSIFSHVRMIIDTVRKYQFIIPWNV